MRIFEDSELKHAKQVDGDWVLNPTEAGAGKRLVFVGLDEDDLTVKAWLSPERPEPMSGRRLRNYCDEWDRDPNTPSDDEMYARFQAMERAGA